MEKVIVEVGFPLEKDLIYYHDMLQKHGLRLVFSCITHDLYYAKDTNFDGLTENQIKNACVRLRFCNELNGKSPYQNKKTSKQEQDLIKQGYTKVFDTAKFDFHYQKDGMKSRIQLQDILGVGLVVYYDNPDYYDHTPDKQRELLIDELNSYGFTFKQTDLCLDKLRTLYFGKKMYSKNVNA